MTVPPPGKVGALADSDGKFHLQECPNLVSHRGVLQASATTGGVVRTCRAGTSRASWGARKAEIPSGRPPT